MYADKANFCVPFLADLSRSLGDPKSFTFVGNVERIPGKVGCPK